MHFRQEIGKWGENLACQYLENNNYHMIERNFFCRRGEIDIIVSDKQKKEIIFVEVKTRSNFRYGNPIEAVNRKKQKHIKQVAQYYLYINQLNEVAIRFDVIEVYIKKEGYTMNHIKQII